MVVCTGGSQLKAGGPAALVLNTQYMQAILPPTLSWLAPLLPYVRPVVVDSMTTFCGSEPPGNPDITSLTLQAVIAGGQVGAAVVAAEAITQLVLNQLWYVMCECVGTATPAPPTPPSAPADLPVINPPVIAPPSAGACLTSVSPRYSIGSFNDFANMLPPHDMVHNADPKPNYYAPLPSNATSFKVVWDTGAVFDTTHRYNITLAFWDAALAFHGVQSVTNRLSGASGTFVGAIDPTWKYYNITLSSPDSGTYPAGNSAGASMTVFCGGAIDGSPSVPCCPPDPILMGLVTQIINAVTLIQRQAVPFGYVAGAVHTGLTGNGSFSVSGLLGCKVDMTTIPPSYGSAVGAPTEHFDLGFVTFGTPDGYPSSQRLDHQPTFFLPARCSAYTELAYTLAPGVAATITELVREP